MGTPAPEPTLCDFCEEPVTTDHPGSNFRCYNTEASLFPYNGGSYSVVLHDDTDNESCLFEWSLENPSSRGEFDSGVVVP